jgi:ppGpp synthetase/RelA/SpoT-type nucleotidyltranferase
MTKSQINRIGDKLRAAGPPDEDTLGQLQQIRSLYGPPMAAVQMLLKEKLGVDATARLKTINTIVEKLRREKTRLAEMHDIAGLRIVRDIGLREQDCLVGQIVALLPGARIVDRRKRPSHGYRAVHVIARVEGRFVEVQIRTAMQDLWAQAMERLADKVGREIRYGGTPKTDVAAFEKLMESAKAVAHLEQWLDQPQDMRTWLSARQGTVWQSKALQEVVEAVQRILAEIAADRGGHA